jgi:DNA polymerase-3 subunit delta
VPDLKPAYLISGDDDAKIDSWRGRVKGRAEAEHGPGGLEAFHAAEHDPGDVAAAMAALSFATGTRYLLADSIQLWKASQVEPLVAALGAMPPDTVVVLIARGKPPAAALGSAVEKAGGEVRECKAPRPRELPKWVVERARDEGVHVDAEAAKALIAAVGPRQQRLARELERLALAIHPSTQLGVEDVERLASGEVAPEVYDLADAVAGADARRALALAERLIARDERTSSLVFPIVRRLRDVHRVAELLEAGVPEQRVAEGLRTPPWIAKRTIGQARRTDRATLERALCALADLEVETRGGSERELDEQTALSLTLARAAG